MINTPPGVKCYSLCLCPTNECTRFLGGPRQRQAWRPFNHTLSIYAHPSFSLKLGQSTVSIEEMLLVAIGEESSSLQTKKNTHTLCFCTTIVTPGIIISIPVPSWLPLLVGRLHSYNYCCCRCQHQNWHHKQLIL